MLLEMSTKKTAGRKMEWRDDADTRWRLSNDPYALKRGKALPTDTIASSVEEPGRKIQYMDRSADLETCAPLPLTKGSLLTVCPSSDKPGIASTDEIRPKGFIEDQDPLKRTEDFGGSINSAVSNVILLPVGYHSEPNDSLNSHLRMSIVGPPQTIIPIAISKRHVNKSEQARFSQNHIGLSWDRKSLLLTPDLCQGVTFPQTFVNVGHGPPKTNNKNQNTPFTLALKIDTKSSPMPNDALGAESHRIAPDTCEPHDRSNNDRSYYKQAGLEKSNGLITTTRHTASNEMCAASSIQQHSADFAQPLDLTAPLLQTTTMPNRSPLITCSRSEGSNSPQELLNFGGWKHFKFQPRSPGAGINPYQRPRVRHLSEGDAPTNRTKLRFHRFQYACQRDFQDPRRHWDLETGIQHGHADNYRTTDKTRDLFANKRALISPDDKDYWTFKRRKITRGQPEAAPLRNSLELAASGSTAAYTSDNRQTSRVQTTSSSVSDIVDRVSNDGGSHNGGDIHLSSDRSRLSFRVPDLAAARSNGDGDHLIAGMDESKAAAQVNQQNGDLQVLPDTRSSLKNYTCATCGIKFSSRKTLDGHQQFYCKNNRDRQVIVAKSNDTDTSKAPLPNNSHNNNVSAEEASMRGQENRSFRFQQPNSDSVAQLINFQAHQAKYRYLQGQQAKQSETNQLQQEFSCQICDFTASNSSQLLAHAKQSHNLIQSYLCLLCGYKGYSIRGMKSHLKMSHRGETLPSGSNSGVGGENEESPVTIENSVAPQITVDQQSFFQEKQRRRRSPMTLKQKMARDFEKLNRRQIQNHEQQESCKKEPQQNQEHEQQFHSVQKGSPGRNSCPNSTENTGEDSDVDVASLPHAEDIGMSECKSTGESFDDSSFINRIHAMNDSPDGSHHSDVRSTLLNDWPKLSLLLSHEQSAAYIQSLPFLDAETRRKMLMIAAANLMSDRSYNNVNEKQSEWGDMHDNSSRSNNYMDKRQNSINFATTNKHAGGDAQLKRKPAIGTRHTKPALVNDRKDDNNGTDDFSSKYPAIIQESDYSGERAKESDSNEPQLNFQLLSAFAALQSTNPYETKPNCSAYMIEALNLKNCLLKAQERHIGSSRLNGNSSSPTDAKAPENVTGDLAKNNDCLMKSPNFPEHGSTSANDTLNRNASEDKIPSESSMNSLISNLTNRVPLNCPMCLVQFGATEEYLCHPCVTENTKRLASIGTQSRNAGLLTQLSAIHPSMSFPVGGLSVNTGAILNQQNYLNYAGSQCSQSAAFGNLMDDSPPLTGPSSYDEIEAGFTTFTAPESGVAKYACKFCTYASAHKGNVKRHLSLVHKAGRNSSCGASGSKMMPSPQTIL